MPKFKDEIEKFPGGWNRILRTRHSGSTIGDKDIYIVSPLGKKLRSTRNLAKHIEEKNLFLTLDPNLVNFGTLNFEKPGQPRKKITKDFIEWLESGGKTQPKFLQPKPKKQIVKVDLKLCRQCEFQYPQVVQENGENLCQYCLIGRTDPYRVLKLFSEQCKFLPLPEDAIKLHKQTGLPFDEITHWFTAQCMQTTSDDFDGIPDFDSSLNSDVKTETDSLNDTKDSLSSLPKNIEIIRKRRPINFTLEDLEERSSQDENWDSEPTSSGSGGPKMRILPNRIASSKIKFDEDFDKVQEEYSDFPPDSSEMPKIQNTIPSVESSQIQGGHVEVDGQWYAIKSEEALDDTLQEESTKSLDSVNDNTEIQDMVIKEEPLDESNNINETDQPLNLTGLDKTVTVKQEPLEENNHISESGESQNESVSLQIKIESIDRIDIKEEILEESDDDIPSDIDVIEEDDDDIPDDIG